MIKLWENFDEADSILNIQTFLLTIVKNLSLNYLKKEQTKFQIHDSILNTIQRELSFRISTLESCDPEVLFSSELRSLFEQTLASLPEQTRRIFEISMIDD